MESTLTQERQRAHAFLDRLPDEQLSAVSGLLESMLSPLDRKLALAPLDDEPLTAEESAAMQAGVDSLDRNGGGCSPGWSWRPKGITTSKTGSPPGLA